MAWLALGLVGGCLIAVVFGHIALWQIRRSRQKGAGLATAGLVLGYLVTVSVILVWVFLLSLPPIKIVF